MRRYRWGAAPLFLAVLPLLAACGGGGLPDVEDTRPSQDERILSAPSAMSDGSEILPHRTETIATSIPLESTGAVGGMSMDAAGNLYSTNFDQNVWRIAPDGTTILLNDEFESASGNFALPDGDLLQADWTAHRIYRIGSDGTRHVFSEEGLMGPVGIARLPDGDFIVANHKGPYLARVPAEGGPAEEVLRDERMTQPNGVTVDDDGNVFIADLGTGIVFKWTPEGELHELATLPGAGNAHNVIAGGALYVNKIWDHVIFRVELDSGAHGIVTGNGYAGYDDGSTGVATIEEPNGIATNADRDVVYFNTHRGAMGGGMGFIVLRKLVLPEG